DKLASIHLSNTSDSCWIVNSEDYLHLNSQIYVLDINDLLICRLRYKHDHPLSGYFGQNWNLELI
ncbi:hypothetical protein PAXRUDRAFT_97794, partial [Paxillus rubicundulus Ve08.2h10]